MKLLEIVVKDYQNERRRDVILGRSASLPQRELISEGVELPTGFESR